MSTYFYYENYNFFRKTVQKLLKINLIILETAPGFHWQILVLEMH